MRYRRIQDLRVDHDIRRKEISELLHVHERTYSYYETGEHRLTAEVLIQLADYYHTSIDYMLGRTDEKRPYPQKRRRRRPLF